MIQMNKVHKMGRPVWYKWTTCTKWDAQYDTNEQRAQNGTPSKIQMNNAHKMGRPVWYKWTTRTKWDAQYDTNEQGAQNWTLSMIEMNKVHETLLGKTKERVTKESKPSIGNSCFYSQIPYSAFWNRIPSLAVRNEISTFERGHPVVFCCLLN